MKKSFITLFLFSTLNLYGTNIAPIINYLLSDTSEKVHDTYFENNTSTAIPDYDLVTLELNVSNAVSSISKVTVTIDITHPYISDLQLFLLSPDDTQVLLVQYIGNNGDENLTGTTFDDDAEISINNGVAPFTGIFRPEEMLGKLIDKNANGTWKLSIHDDNEEDSGIFNSWSMAIE